MKMMRNTVRSELIKRLAALLLCILLGASVLPPGAALAHDTQKVVRVGWFDSSYNTVDPFGRRSGYAYEYQLKIAAYTGWSYEYVTGSWSELLSMLIKGDIDLMSDVSYTAERSERMLFPELPMGAEEYYLFVSPETQGISSADISTLNGKRIGVNKDSIQADFYLEWAKRNGVEAELVKLTGSEDESLRMLETGELDAYVTVDSFTDPSRAVPVAKVGSSDFFFAVNKNRPDLLKDLNSAMSRLQGENRYFNQQMFERYMKTAGANAFLTADELSWLSAHGTIRVGYQDNYLAFCAADKTSGELTGAMKDYLDSASACLENARLSFSARAYPTMEDAVSAMKNGEVDCVFPANLSGYDGEKLGIVMTPPLIRTDIYAVVRQSDLNTFTNREHVIVAVNEGNPNYETFLLDHYPNWQKVYYTSTADCLKAVSERVADCVLISSYRYNNIYRQCEKHHLTTIPTGLEMDYCLTVDKGEKELYSILSKMVCLVPTSTFNSALSYYITEDAKLSLGDFIEDNLTGVMIGITLVVLAILFLLLRSMRAERRAKQLISATEIDSLSGLYNRDYFFQYANRTFREHPDMPMDAVVLNIEQFHSINALNGRDFGDQILRVLGSELHSIAEGAGGIAGRFGADRFDCYCRHAEDYQAVFDRLQSKVDAMSPNASVILRMGVALGQPGIEPVQLFDRARIACTQARGHFKERLIVFDEKVRERELLDQRLINDLRRALDNYELEVHYQPKFDVVTETPRLVSAEALVRWQHPELGLIAPDVFVPLFERCGKISEMDKYVWSEAGRQIARWQAHFGRTIPVSVNLSRVDVFDPTLEKNLDDIIRQNGLERDALKLELTESAYTENAEQVIRVVEGLRQKGYTVEMDDFGTGYSSLNMLSAMPVDVLKMDRTFIRNMENNERDVQLVALILGIARNLKIPVIAEGVETEAQLQILRNLGCTLVQGYYFSRPLHPTEFEAVLLSKSEINT